MGDNMSGPWPPRFTFTTRGIAALFCRRFPTASGDDVDVLEEVYRKGLKDADEVTVIGSDGRPERQGKTP